MSSVGGINNQSYRKFNHSPINGVNSRGNVTGNAAELNQLAWDISQLDATQQAKANALLDMLGPRLQALKSIKRQLESSNQPASLSDAFFTKFSFVNGLDYRAASTGSVSLAGLTVVEAAELPIAEVVDTIPLAEARVVDDSQSDRSAPHAVPDDLEAVILTDARVSDDDQFNRLPDHLRVTDTRVTREPAERPYRHTDTRRLLYKILQGAMSALPNLPHEAYASAGYQKV